MSQRTYVDDGEVWVEAEGDGWRLGVRLDDRGSEVSHLLTAADAATLSAALVPPRCFCAEVMMDGMAEPIHPASQCPIHGASSSWQPT